MSHGGDSFVSVESPLEYLSSFQTSINTDKRLMLKEKIKINLYISGPPSGDAVIFSSG